MKNIIALLVVTVGLSACDTKDTPTNKKHKESENVASTQTIIKEGGLSSLKGTSENNTVKEHDSKYIDLVHAIKQNPNAVDFNAFRWAYTHTTFYKPYSGPESNHRKLLNDAMVEKKWTDCIEMAETIFHYNYTSLHAHYGAMACYKENQNSEKETLHNAVLNKLLDAIQATGDGKTKETALVTISTGELRAFVELLGYDIMGREKIEEKDSVYDLINVKSRDTRINETFYFNISRQWSAGQRNVGEVMRPVK